MVVFDTDAVESDEGCQVSLFGPVRVCVLHFVKACQRSAPFMYITKHPFQFTVKWACCVF